jgi:hypothetical protein
VSSGRIRLKGPLLRMQAPQALCYRWAEPALLYANAGLDNRREAKLPRGLREFKPANAVAVSICRTQSRRKAVPSAVQSLWQTFH